jgi:hypothetical protein
MVKIPRGCINMWPTVKRISAAEHGTFKGLILGAVLLWAGMAPVGAVASDLPPLKDEPVVWFANDRNPIPAPAENELGMIPYAMNSFVGRPFSRFWNPSRFVRWVGNGDRARLASDINVLGEVVNSSWFQNRIGLAPMSDEEIKHGAGFCSDLYKGPDRSKPWLIIGAKTAGVTPGFRIKDGRGDVWLLKFDPPSHPGMTIRAGAVSNLIFHAAGYNVPVDRLVSFKLDELAIAEGATMKAGRYGTTPLTKANLDSVLVSTGSFFNGEYQALASRYLKGKPLGPFDDQGTRKDDPNDTIKHQDRRELRGYRILAAWLNHFDTKAQNSLDVYVGEPGQGYIKHYLIDFASTLGAYGDEPVKRFGFEFGLDVFPMMGRLVALGFHEDPWVYVQRPDGLDEVGLFEAEYFEPEKWKPDLPNSMMANLNRADGYWAAKIVSAFSEHQLRLVVQQGQYQNPQAVDYLVETLMKRRDKIVRHWFTLVTPLDFFTNGDGGVQFKDLGSPWLKIDGSEARYRYRLQDVDPDRNFEQQGLWVESSNTCISLAEVPGGSNTRPFLAMEVQVNRGNGWSPSVIAYRAYASGRIVGMDRH